MKPCPRCGASVDEEASFCPYCAESINRRTVLTPPSRPVRRRHLLAAAAVLAMLILAGWWIARPRVYDNGGAEVIYSTHTGSYRLCFAKDSAPDIALSETSAVSETNFDYRYPTQIYALHADSGELATEEFLSLVDAISAEVNTSDSYLSITCTDASRRLDYRPNAIALTYIDYRLVITGEHEAEVVFTITMKNGDVIRLHQLQRYQGIAAYKFTPQDAPMNTIEELQALVDQLSETTDEESPIYFYLPPMTYEGGLTITDRSINLCGSVDSQGRRTTFTGPTQVSFQNFVCEFSNIDFIGRGEGVGITAMTRVHLTNCRVSGWETGFLAAGNGWINTIETVLDHNTVGMHFNLTGAAVSSSFYSDNVFRNNGTAILLERIPSGTTLSFPGTRFLDNGTDIDNRCDQKLDISQAIFE